MIGATHRVNTRVVAPIIAARGVTIIPKAVTDEVDLFLVVNEGVVVESVVRRRKEGHPNVIPCHFIFRKGIVVDPEKVEAIKRAIMDLYTKWFHGALKIEPNWNEIQRYEAREVTKKLADVLDTLQ